MKTGAPVYIYIYRYILYLMAVSKLSTFVLNREKRTRRESIKELCPKGH